MMKKEERRPINFCQNNRTKAIRKNDKSVIGQRIYMPPSKWYWLNCEAEKLGLSPGKIVQNLIDKSVGGE